MTACPACGAENAPGRKFCGDCGASLARLCPACGTPNEPGVRFCGECGGALDGIAPAVASAPLRAAERRLVSVLFADLVGFTTISESRDPEEVRALLSRYFELCRRLIGIYGGTVEKFIGDAVMAVWGTPVAQEDDAERAVRAALDLVAAVAQLGAEVGAEGLRLRAGVMTGEAAVTLGADAEGMVAGDLVNTASRVQAAAEPGTVLVGDSTRRASAAAIAYEPTGTHELKGKAEPVALFRALRVTSVRGGALRTGELEPPFVGRERELYLVKELFHATSEERKAHLVTVVGIGGIGKSRLAWEFEKYLDGVTEQVWWHRGRCLAYGDGVAYWALAEMVRMRALISEEDAPREAVDKLRAMLAEWIADESEREWLEPRLANLLGLAEHGGGDRQDLFSAWRLLFERLAERGPVLLVFEDLQWADTSLLDFVEYLLDWSRAHPIFVLALARPELAERRPGFGAGGRNQTMLSLEPLSQRAMEELLDGFVPGLPADLRAQILARAEGVPLYAVETVRMLLDRGLLLRDGDVYRPTGPIESLEVPETLHALIAARLDGLSADERRVLQDAAVLGKSFTKAGVAALSGLDEDTLEPILNALIRKEVLSVQADPRSPERGQYGFLQDLLKRIAYETLSRADRKSRHLAAAGHLEQAWSAAEQELVELVAAHYVDAYEAVPDAPDADALRARAAERLVLAGERAGSLGATEEAQRYYEKAAGLVDETLLRAELLERAGEAASAGARHDAAVALLEQSASLYDEAGSTHAGARVAARVGVEMWRGGGDLRGGAERLEQALGVLADDEPDAEIAALVEALGRLRYFLGDHDAAAERIERALEIAEALVVPEVLAHALNTKNLLLIARGRSQESQALLERSIAIAREHDLAQPLLRALNNLAVLLGGRSRFGDAHAAAQEGIDVARRLGNRDAEQQLLSHVMWGSWLFGDWQRMEELLGLVTADAVYPDAFRVSGTVLLELPRGGVGRAREILDARRELRNAVDAQIRSLYLLSEARVLRAEGRPADAAESARGARLAAAELHERLHAFAWEEQLEDLAAAGDLDGLEECLAVADALAPVERTPFVDAVHARFRAQALAGRGEQVEAEQWSERARRAYRSLGFPYYEAIVQAEQAGRLLAEGRAEDAAAPLAEAREVFARLGARPWLERCDELAAGIAVAG